MKTIDINDIESNEELEFLQRAVFDSCHDLVSFQAGIHRILNVPDNDVAVVVKFINGDLTIIAGDHNAITEAVKNGKL